MKTRLLMICTLLPLLSVYPFAKSYSQLAVTHMIGKNASQTKTGFGVFAYYDFYTTEDRNRAIRLELLDFNYFPPKENVVKTGYGFVSIKLGYKYVFSETGTGFYVIPEAGYSRVAKAQSDLPEATYGDGVAGALEGGYCIELGERGNPLHFGLKYEADYGNKNHFIQSLAFRVSISFFSNRRRW